MLGGGKGYYVRLVWMESNWGVCQSLNAKDLFNINQAQREKNAIGSEWEDGWGKIRPFVNSSLRFQFAMLPREGLLVPVLNTGMRQGMEREGRS